MKFRPKYSSQHETVFESFSDMVLCVIIVLFTLIIALALNIQREFPVMNRFTGGIIRPEFFLQAGVADLAAVSPSSGTGDSVMVHLFSPSMAGASTRVDDGQVVARDARHTFFGQLDLNAYQFLQLAAGIDPGQFNVEGADTSLMLPKFVSKVILYGRGGFREVPDRSLAMDVMKLAWPIYRQPLYSVRSPSEFSTARTRVYIETVTNGDERWLYIGHMKFRIPEDIKNGSLSWLEGMTSSLTEIVFLGEMWSDPVNRSDRRIEFFENNGFPEAAEACQRFEFDLSAANRLAAQKAVSAALMNGTPVDESLLPPLLVYQDAWAAYVKESQKSLRSLEAASTEVPEWFLVDFLEPLSFDRRILN